MNLAEAEFREGLLQRLITFLPDSSGPLFSLSLMSGKTM